jgi:two-component system, LytTR family, response regulator AlgR
MSRKPLRVLIVDDEAPARIRLRDLLMDLAIDEPTEIVGLLANGQEALDFVSRQQIDVAFLDVRMPVIDGVDCARQLATLTDAPHVIFVTAYDEYAVQAFDLAAADYLMKPVRLKRLMEALGKVRRQSGVVEGSDRPKSRCPRSHLSVPERGRITLVPVDDVLYFRAESKYICAQTRERGFLLEEALAHLEREFSDRFLRIHRNCLVAKAAIRAVEVHEPRPGDAQEPVREVCLRGCSERLPVSRRLWRHLRKALTVDQLDPPLVG